VLAKRVLAAEFLPGDVIEIERVGSELVFTGARAAGSQKAKAASALN
jgi:hypothetical protein